MLYALVLIVTTTTLQPVASGAMGYAPGAYATAPYMTSQTSQQIIGYYRTERGCLGASLKRNQNWPDFAPGQSVTGLCVQVEIPVGADIIGGS
ncbi:hypothetical protein EZH22_16860 [Xanthobacter dioxanivorans]|uniref:Uncharacterized protein n=1 Tax=Xanthobacter dioxanivorans TaxID=2528964 RepID=A0A974PK94_9HYPH|nr:hypothetical protein [Xanthobacter dioxanivorans]QRG04821.1 hypothetical protein EZH22_16860 [Xanthobacter dioxanivorans]